MPSFWFGIILILIFAVRLRWLPAIGYSELTEDGFVEWLKRLILPSLAIGAGYSAILMRFVRAGLLEVLGSDYVRTARAKGVRERAVVVRHALRNALIPVVTVIGIQLALLLSGAVVDGDGLLDPRHRPHPGRRHLRPRLPDRAGGDSPDRGDLRPGQSGRRHPLYLPRPEDSLWLGR